MSNAPIPRSLMNIDTRIAKYPIVLLSPHCRRRNAFLATFLAEPDTYLYTLSVAENTPSAFVRGLGSSLQAFFPDFGAQTTQALEAGPVDLAEMLVADLKSLKGAAKTLILDDLDRVCMDEAAAAFFECLLRNMPSEMRFVINSRILPEKPWRVLARAGQAVVLGEEDRLETGILNPDLAAKPPLDVYGFGTGHVFVNGLPIEIWDGPLPRNLFLYFVDHPYVTRDEIYEVFWPGMATKEATNVFHVTKRKVNERVGYELTTYVGGLYRLSDKLRLHYDVVDFEKASALAVDAGADAMEPLYYAVQLYHHEFLYTNSMPWISARREQLRLRYAEALVSLGRIYAVQGNDDMAISFYLRALREVPLREDVHRDVMTIYGRREDYRSIRAQYKILKDNLHRTLDIAPSPAICILYRQLTGDVD